MTVLSAPRRPLSPISQDPAPVRVWSFWVVLAALGPYLTASAGIRLEHIAVYGIAGVALLGAYRYTFDGPVHSFHKYGILFFISAVFWLVGWHATSTSIDIDRTLSGVDGYLRSAVLLVAIPSLVLLSRWSRRTLLRAAGIALIGALWLNTALAVGQSAGIALQSVVQPFFRGYDYSQSVAVTAIEAGRYGGIFNQPFEQGIAYSLGLIVAVWFLAEALATHRTGEARLLFISILLISWGGLVGGSKVFLLGGVPIAVLLAVATLTRVRDVVAQTGQVGRAVVAGGTLIVAAIFSIIAVPRLADANAARGLLDVVTAGRFGADQDLIVAYFQDVWHAAPIQGLGFTGVAEREIVTDNGLLSHFAHGGIPLLVGAIAFWLLLVYAAWIAARTREGYLFAAVALLALLSDLGAPAFFVPRSGTLLWLFLLLAIPWSPQFRQPRRTAPEG